MLRRREQLSADELAQEARVNASELRRIELDPTFDPNPRTIFQLEQYFKLSSRSLVVLSGAVHVDDNVPDLKKRHAEGHEIIHSIMPHHGLFLFGDDQETLRSFCHEKLEAEANFGSGQLLFLRGRFVAEAHDLPRTRPAGPPGE